MKKYFLLVVIISCSLYCQNKDSLTGVWQDNEIVAAGWTNTFLFFSDGTFKFFYNQMDMRKKEISFSGSWKVESDGLYLQVKQQRYIDGGRLVEDPTGAKGDSVLTGGLIKTRFVDPPEKMEMSISKIYTDTEYAMGKYIYLDAIKFYLMSTNPEEMLKQFEK